MNNNIDQIMANMEKLVSRIVIITIIMITISSLYNNMNEP